MNEALKLALEALEYASTGNRRPEIIGPAITAIKEALAQPVQRPWVGLTDEDKDEIIRVTESDHYHDILMLAEAKLKEKNT